jgi:hypothetical protein
LSADLSVVAEACGAFGLISADFLVVDPNQQSDTSKFESSARADLEMM